MRSGGIKNKKHFLSYSPATRELAEPQQNEAFFFSRALFIIFILTLFTAFERECGVMC